MIYNWNRNWRGDFFGGLNTDLKTDPIEGLNQRHLQKDLDLDQLRHRQN